MGKLKKKKNSDVEEETNDQEINEKDISDDDYCEDNYGEDDKLEDETEHCSDATYLARRMLLKERLSRADAMVINFGGI